jgi:ATP/maltotriose-dependent transcriptional regulator MalT
MSSAAEQAVGTATEWRRVHEELSRAEPHTLCTDELERLAEAAFWLGEPRQAIAARRHAYLAYRNAGETAGAARSACALFHQHFDLDEIAAASGWLKRAERHARELDGSVEEGYVALARADWALYGGDADAALAAGRTAIDIGGQHHDRDLEALAQATVGRVLVERGDIGEGLDLLDDAMLAAANDELTPLATGWVYCLLLSTCQEIGEVRRAAEWTELAVSWCERRGQDSWYPGLCRLHRCEVQAMRGEWAAAEREALRAAEELAPFGGYLVADGYYLAGEIRRHRGDLLGAEEAFRRAHELGRDPQPGLALVRLEQGEAEAAARSLRVALDGGAGNQVGRARLLAALVRAELQLGDVEAAATSAAQLDGVATANGRPLLRGMAALAMGCVLLARDDLGTALRFLRLARSICRELSCPYEAAEAQLLLGTAARRAGDEETARLEFESARAMFERLGATTATERAAALLSRGEEPHPRGLTDRELEVLVLVACGRSNRQIAQALVISQHTVSRHLTNLYRKLGVTTRSAATAFAFRNGLV